MELASGDVPFTEQYVMGVQNLRGYTNGKYRSDQIYSTQAEFRWRFWRRCWGMYFGIGEVF